MKPRLAPSVLSLNHADLVRPVSELIAEGVEIIHFDVMDGQFVPPITIGDGVVRGLASLRKPETLFEVHLMTQTPERQFQAFVEAGCGRVIFHAEATSHAHRLVQSLKEMGVEAGVAINPATPIQSIEPIAQDLDLALVMTVNPGWGGQRLIRSALDKVRLLRRHYPNLEIEVDGGIDAETLPEALAAGANTFVAGSYLARASSIAEGVAALRRACV